jgi:hypothetical protein
MIQAIIANRGLRRAFKANEDALTSSVFERLMYLPKELFQQIVSKALLQEIPNLDLTQIESLEYWPHWDSEGSTNKNFVEPDIFIRTKNQDIIIEAKRYDSRQQYKGQWKNELVSYKNVYGEEQKELIFIALGGLRTKSSEKIEILDQEIVIYKCKWSGILQSVLAAKDQIDKSSNLLNTSGAISNILGDIIMTFRLFGFSTAPWFEYFMKPVSVNPDHIQKLNFDFQWKK